MPALVAGAEPWSVEAGSVGALCLHGFTGHPGSMRPVAEAFAAAGFSVELPRLPGHGTTVDDMVPTRWADWSAAAEAAYQRLAGRCRAVVIAGQSMGGALTLWLGAEHPEVAGLVCINPVTRPLADDVVALVREMAEAGERTLPAVGGDIADPDVTETAYDEAPLEALLSLTDALRDLQARYAAITSPLLLLTSPQDHVVDPGDSDHVAALVAGPVERVTLQRSYHVATLDFDRDLIRERAVAFARQVTGQ